MNVHRRLVVIVGPTASGKSALAITLAERLNGEVVACDSTQVYRYFDIGTGKVPAAERRGIRHHLIDLAEPDEVFTAGEGSSECDLRAGEAADLDGRDGALLASAAGRIGRRARAF